MYRPMATNRQPMKPMTAPPSDVYDLTGNPGRLACPSLNVRSLYTAQGVCTMVNFIISTAPFIFTISHVIMDNKNYFHIFTAPEGDYLNEQFG